MKNIFVPTDFTTNSEKAYALAADLARSSNSTITLYHSTSPVFLGGLIYAGFQTVQSSIHDHNIEVRDSRKKMELTSQLSVFEGIDIKTYVEDAESNQEADNTLDYIQSKEYDLVIMGISGSDDGSADFADEIVRESSVPTIVVHNTGVSFKNHNFLIATDFKTVNAKFFKTISKLASDNTKLSILYVNTEDNFMTEEEYENEYAKLVNKYYLKNTTLIHKNANSVEEGVLNQIDEGSYDMLCLTTKGSSKLARFFFGSVTEELLHKTNIPTMILNLKDFLDQKKTSAIMGNMKSSMSQGVNQKAIL